MTPADLKDARRKLGLSQTQMARVLNVGSDRTVRKWEDAEREIPGTVHALVDLMLNVPGARERLEGTGVKGPQ